MKKHLQNRGPMIAAVVLICAAFLSAANVSVAQSLGQSGNGTPDADQIEASLESLMRATSSLRDRVRTNTTDGTGEPTLTPIPALSPRPNPPTIVIPDSPVSGLPIEMNDIRDRIKLLKRLRSRSDNIELSAAMLAQPPVSMAKIPSNVIDPPTPKDPTLTAIEKSLESTTKSPDPSQTTTPQIHSTQVLSSPIDTLRLGESLYRTKNYVAALKALRSVDTKASSKSDLIWRDLLMALCERRLGDTDASEALLRDLANAKNPDFSNSVARWWLKQIALTKDVKPTLENISTETETLIIRAQNYANE